jgi:hypothetical protein
MQEHSTFKTKLRIADGLDLVAASGMLLRWGGAGDKKFQVQRHHPRLGVQVAHHRGFHHWMWRIRGLNMKRPIREIRPS